MGNRKRTRYTDAYYTYRRAVLAAFKANRAAPEPPAGLGATHARYAIEWARASLPASHGHSLERHAARSGHSNRRGRQARSRG